MRRLTFALLCGAYLCLSLIVALTLWRSGGGWGAGVAALLGGLGLCCAVHGLIQRLAMERAQRGELEALREAYRLLLDQMHKLDARIGQVAETLVEERDATPPRTTEIEILEQLVERLEARGREAPQEPRAPGRREPVERRTTASLMDTVREALAENRVDLYLQPVVGLPQRRTIFYESFTRLRDESGRVLMPTEYLSVAEPGGLVTAIDNLLLFRCVQVVRRLAKQDRRVGIFCNISMASLADEDFFGQFAHVARFDGAPLFEGRLADLEDQGAGQVAVGAEQVEELGEEALVGDAGHRDVAEDADPSVLFGQPAHDLHAAEQEEVVDGGDQPAGLGHR